MREITIRLTDADYAAAQKRAQGRGIEAFVIEMLQADLQAEDPDNFDHIFTPEYLEKLHAASAEARAGKTHTMEQVKAHLAAKREASLAKNV